MFRTRGLRAVVLLLLATTACGDMGGGDDESSVPTPPPTRAPDSVVAIRGTLESFHGEDTAGPPIPLPFTIELPERGMGDATFSRAVVGGTFRSVSWTGGRPLALTGDGSLDLGPTTVDIDSTGVKWALDGGPRIVTGTKWRTDAPVAVGDSGIATSRDGIEFEASPDTVVITSGGAFVRHAVTGPLHIEGPGRFTITGDLVVESAQEEPTRVTRVRMEDGPFALDLTPGPGGTIRVEGGMQGRVLVNDTVRRDR